MASHLERSHLCLASFTRNVFTPATDKNPRAESSTEDRAPLCHMWLTGSDTSVCTPKAGNETSVVQRARHSLVKPHEGFWSWEGVELACHKV